MLETHDSYAVERTLLCCMHAAPFAPARAALLLRRASGRHGDCASGGYETNDPLISETHAIESGKWPKELLVVRHGESAGNVARDRALAARAALIDIDSRDCDVPLSELGERQARALGLWLPRHYERAHALLVSPYLRARETAAIALDAAGWEDVPVVCDERLREKEFGILDRLTRTGIEQRYPEQAAMRDSLGKFYYRPPGGESWTDVLLRLRSIIDTLTREYSGQRVCIVSHQVVVLCFRYLLERMTEAEILAIDRAHEIANCSVTTYRFDAAAGTRGKLCLAGFNVVAPMEEAGAAVTTSPDVPIARK